MNEERFSNGAESSNRDEKALARFYQESEEYRAALGEKPDRHFAAYVALVRRFVQPGARMLEVGCGACQSSRMLAACGFKVVASDLSALFLAGARGGGEVPRRVAADIVRLPFGDQTFDAVCAVETIEHLPNVGPALDEMTRVTRVGGWIVLRSPALASPSWPLIDLPNLLRAQGGRPPHYETLAQAAGFFAANMARTARILARRRPVFERRKPDLSPGPVGGDRDAAYWSSPVEIARGLKSRGFHIAQTVDGGGRFSPKRLAAWLAPWLSPTFSLAARRES